MVPSASNASLETYEVDEKPPNVEVVDQSVVLVVMSSVVVLVVVGTVTY